MKQIFALLLSIVLSAEAFAREEVGNEFRITVVHKSESKGEDFSSSSTSGSHEYIERIIAVRPDGVERIVDLSLDPDDERRLIEWYFPVKVFRSNDGITHLLNREEMEIRRDIWLKAAEISPEACGSWYFTWNVFQVECDPDSILGTLETINIQPPNLADGELFQHPAALEPGKISLDSPSDDAAIYRVQMTVNPDSIHLTQAHGDVIVGEIMKEPVSFDDAYAMRKKVQITGEIEVVLEALTDGQIWRRTTTTKIEKVEADGNIVRQVSTEVIERISIKESHLYD